MNGPGNRREAIGNWEDGFSQSFWPIASRLLPIACSCIVLTIVFWGLLEVDLRLVRFLRSIHLDWLERAGDVGNRLGSGVVLVVISATFLLAGWWLKRPTFRQAGLDGLLAHGAVALIVQMLKHLIGRPRPRMTHGGGFQLGPSLGSGLDSFPSGHAAASFAVASVLARHFPRAAWLFYGAAAVVVVSRVARGSHFPTDVMTGLCLGVLVGALFSNPLRAWRRSLSRALIDLTPYLVGGFGLLWVAVHPAPDEWTDRTMLGAGIVISGIGVAGRLYRAGKGRWAMGDGLGHHAHSLSPIASRLLIGIGLALATGSALVTVLAMLAISAQWLAFRSEDFPDPQSARTHEPAYFREAVLASGLILAIVLLQGLKGILPIL